MHLPLSLLCLAPFASLWDSCQQTQFKAPNREHVVRKRIAIVGGGTGGLAALKTFLHDIPKAQNEEWDITLYEQRLNVGGVWLNETQPPNEPQLPETAIYPRLHTNFPVPIMTFPGFPFPPMTPLYAPYPVVQSYHEAYAEHYDLFPYIRLNHSVAAALWVGNSTQGHWDLALQSGFPVEKIPGASDHTMKYQNEDAREQFDHLVVANGHNHYPNIPEWSKNPAWVEGKEGRRVFHSVFFREPEDFTGKTVLVVGGGPSGVDIAAQLSEYASTTYHSFRPDPKRPWPLLPSITYKSRTTYLTETSVVFDDGSEASDVDIIILATGYEYRFPFLCDHDPYAVNSTKPKVGKTVLFTNGHARSRVNGGSLVSNLNYVFPLHKHTISLSSLHPLNALSFIGLPQPLANAPSDLLQSLLIGHMIANRSAVFAGSEDAVRTRLLDGLTVYENELKDQGFDPYKIGHRLFGRDNNGTVYVEGMYSDLKASGVIPDDGNSYLPEWRDFGVRNIFPLLRIWKEIEETGNSIKWLKGVKTEEEWGDLLRRLVRYGENRR